MTKAKLVPDGYDPTQEEFPLRGPTLRSCLFRLGCMGGLAAVGLATVVIMLTTRGAAAAPTPTPIPTITPYPTYTAYPTWTLSAETFVPRGTQLVMTPVLNTLTPTPTLNYVPAVTWTPGAWMLTRFAKESMK